MRNASPLRYPGGKWRFFLFFEKLISENFETGPVYIEPYAGGASLALSLLFADKVKEIYLNDIDPAIYAFWHSVMNHNDRFCELVQITSVTPYEWSRQREIYRQGGRLGKFPLGFATFFLNRTNHSGILNGGMIGGKSQQGKWRIDARFNRAELVRRLILIASFRSRIHLSCMDAMDFLRHHRRGRNKLIYLDPPYFGPGRRLYYNAYGPNDHADVRNRISELPCPWLISYDDIQPIRKLYRKFRWRRVQWRHTARASRQGHEIIYFSPQLIIPRVCVEPSA
jgi:DNA adenine methylase